MSHWSDPYIELIDDCEAREEKMTDWDRKFVDSIKEQIERGKGLSIPQSDKLDEIWEKVTKKG